ncbi:MAG TPA: hypothetical protein VIL99_14255 [Ignavibacteria bacterium]
MNIKNNDSFSGDFLKNRFGPIPNESGFKKRMHLHQGWWRTYVLDELPGMHPTKATENICNTILNGQQSNKNFLTKNTISTVEKTLSTRDGSSLCMIEEDRLFNNLLSSQPLCFNFFSELSINKNIGLKLLQYYYPELTELINVYFEYAPPENYTNDNTAFDVAFEVMAGTKSGIIGWECKYTDNFSTYEYDKPEYRELYSKSKSFRGAYEELANSRTNQLFRSQLIAEGLLQNKKYEFVFTGLFCHQDDINAIKTANDFSELLNFDNINFRVVTYPEFIKCMQMLDIDWSLREWSMLLWARYCGTVLSESTVNKL